MGGRNAQSDQTAAEAPARAERLRPILAELAEMSADQAATELNRRKVPTPAGGQWFATQVMKIGMSKQIIAYTRVSTQKQGQSGLGLEGQKAAIARFCAAEGYAVTQTFTEIETAKGVDALERRPQLKSALRRAAAYKCPIVVATATASPSRRADAPSCTSTGGRASAA